MTDSKPDGYDSRLDALMGSAYMMDVPSAEIEKARAELVALRERLAAWEECAEPFEITDPEIFKTEIKRLMDDPQNWMLSLDKAMRERDALRAQVSAVEKKNAELHREIATVVETYRGANEELHRHVLALQSEHCQVDDILGRALGYPKDATGDHTPGTLAEEAAQRLGQLHRELEAAKDALKAVLDDPAKCYGPCNETRAKVSAALEGKP